jgi:predicted dehydrogenase
MKEEQEVSRRNFLRSASAVAAGAPFILQGARGAPVRAGGDRVYSVAILSTAHTHTRSFMNNLDAGEDRRTVYVWDDVEDRGRRYAEQFNVPFEPDLEAVLSDSAVDGFIICAENTRHLPLLERALPTGKPVFCEKPLVTTTEDLIAVKALLEKHHTPLFCGYFLPFSGEMREVKNLVDEGVLGDITRINLRNSHHAAYGRWFDNPDLAWFTDPELAGGGAFMDMGTHAIHLALTLFGSVERVWAAIRNESGIYPGVDDFGVAQVEFASGVLGRVEAAWTQTGGIGGLEIVGSEGSLWHDGSGYRHGGPGRPGQVVEPGEGAPNRVDRLIAILRGEVSREELDRDLEATMDAVIVMEAAYRSSESGGWRDL